jgi:hypothetical protein
MQDPSKGFGPNEFLTSQQIRSFRSRLAQQRKNKPTNEETEASDGNPNPRYIRGIEDDEAEEEEVILYKAAANGFLFIEPADYDILEVDPL